jgi:hypothetical protein
LLYFLLAIFLAFNEFSYLSIGDLRSIGFFILSFLFEIVSEDLVLIFFIEKLHGSAGLAEPKTKFFDNPKRPEE